MAEPVLLELDPVPFAHQRWSIFNPSKDHAATPDGSTACAAAIQASINDAAADGGGTVYLPTGTWSLEEAIVPAAGVSIVGDGRKTVLQLRAGATYNAIDTSGTNPDNVVLRNFAIDCNNVTGRSAIYGDFTVSRFEGLTIFNCKANAFDMPDNLGCFLNHWEDNWAEADGIVFNVAAADSWCVDNYFFSTGDGATVDCRCMVLGAGPWNVRGNHLQGGRYNVYQYALSGGPVRFTGNLCELAQREAIRVEVPSYWTVDGDVSWIIEGCNIVKASQAGAGLYPFVSLVGYDSTHRMGDVTLSDCTFLYSTSKPSSAVAIDRGFSISLRGNRWRGQYNGAAAVSLTNSAGADTIDIVGNCGDNTVTGSTQWREIGASGEPAFANSWVNFNSGTHQTAGFRKTADGFVELKGLIKSGTVTAAAFVLPAGYRPALIVNRATDGNGAFAEVYVDASGNVVPQVGSNAYFSLNGVKFQPGV